MTLELSSPFPPESIHWRAQTLTRDGDKALALAYLDARDVMDRLDAVCGPMGWQDSYTETASGRVLGTISILFPDVGWIAKSDGAGNTAVEGEKGGISDAFKRTAVKWGIGRYLYDLGNVWAPCESRDNNGKKQWLRWKPEAQQVFAAALNRLTGVQSAPPASIAVPLIDQSQHDELMLLMSGTGYPVARFLERAGISNLNQLPAKKLKGARQWLDEELAAMEKANA